MSNTVFSEVGPDAAVENRASVQLSPAWSDPFQLACKRALDILGSLIALIGLSPFYCLLALGIRLSSRGPVFYLWHVVGKDGVPFTSYKFRSMYANADQMKASLKDRNEMRGPVFKLTDDPRVTKMGAWMRRYSLDELPQFYSVLKGDMSLVGPRPPLTDEYHYFTEWQKQKLLVKSGMTCLWQVKGRNDIQDFDDWVKLDLDYIREWSIGLDLKILLFTLREVLVGSGK